jgi:D-alanine-D-alanine ligase
MDKAVFKDLMKAHGIPQLDYAVVRDGERPQLGFDLPAFVKPARLGSSVGISKATSPKELEDSLRLAFEHDPVVVIEKMAQGLEVECSVLGNSEPEASVPGEIVVRKGDWYDYEAKYGDGGMELVVPARIPDQAIERVRELAVRVFRAVDGAGLARVDFFAEPDGQVYVNELNTLPGFTATSVYAKLFDASGVPYGELLERLLALALERHQRERSYRF